MKRFLLFLSVVFAIGIMAKAETATLTYSELYSSDTEVTTAIHNVANTTDGTIATVSYEKGSASAPKYFNNGTSVRLYAEKIPVRVIL